MKDTRREEFVQLFAQIDTILALDNSHETVALLSEASDDFKVILSDIQTRGRTLFEHCEGSLVTPKLDAIKDAIALDTTFAWDVGGDFLPEVIL